MYLIVPSGLTVTVPFVGAPTPDVDTVGVVTFVRSATVPSVFLSFDKTGILVGNPITIAILSRLANGEAST